jgi:4-amino-4-deoxy-L-arabinose transferase-like glycosyltransferase
MKTRISMLPSWLFVAPILLLVFTFSIDGVNRYTIRRDELTTLGHIGALEKDNDGVSFAYTIESLSLYSPEHAPVFYMLANIWGKIFEFNYFPLRMLSVWFGIIAAASTYWLGRRMVSHTTGFFTIIIFGTNVVFYGTVHEMRAWMMLVMFAMLVWMFYWHMAHKRQPIKPIEFFALFITILIGIYINYMMFFILLALGLYHLLVLPKDKRWWQITVTVCIAGILYVPWLPVLLDGLINTQDRMVKNIPGLLDNLKLIPATLSHWGNGYPLLFIVLIGTGLYASWKNWKIGRNIVFFCVMLLGSLLIANGIFVFVRRIRYIILWAIPFSLLIGYGLAVMTRQKRLRFIPPLLIGIWIIGGHQFTYTNEFQYHLAKDRVVLYPEYPSLLPILREHTEKRNLLIQAYYEYSAIQESKQGLISIANYYMRDLKLKIVNFPLYVQWSDSEIDATPVDYATGLIPQYDEFWFSYHHTQITDEIIDFHNRVAENYTICEDFEYGERSILVRYVRSEELAELCKQHKY